MPADGTDPTLSAPPLPPVPSAVDADAVVARVYAFLAAALAGDQRPKPAALAAELARVLEVQSLAVLCDDGDDLCPVLSYGFAGDPVEELGADFLDEAFGDGMAVLVEGEAPHRTRLAVPANFGGAPWGVVAVASSLPDAISPQTARRVEDLAQGIAVVLGPLAPVEGGTGTTRARAMRAGIETIAALAASFEGNTTHHQAAKALVDGAAREFGWQRVALVTERGDLGVLPIAVGGEVQASSLIAPDRIVSALADSAAKRDPFFAGSRSQLVVGMEPAHGAVAAILVVEDVRREAFDELDEHAARTLSTLAGPLLRRLAGHTVRQRDADAATASDERQRRRFTSLAHELRTPVTVMLGYADLLATPGRDSEQRQAYAGTLARHARSLGRMVDNALVAWQLDDGSLELSPGVVDLNECVTEVIQQLEAEIDVSGVANVAASADSFWLPKVVHALLENARRYVPDAQVKLSTEARGDQVRLAVHDDGPGISSDELQHIFDAFHRGAEGGTQPHRGVGLGLTVARALVREMGGDLTAASAPGYGTTLTISLTKA